MSQHFDGERIVDVEDGTDLERVHPRELQSKPAKTAWHDLVSTIRAAMPSGSSTDDDQPSSCALCGAKAAEVGCESGWVWSERGQGMTRCLTWKRRREDAATAALMKAIGIEEARYAKSWDELTITHSSWRTALELSKRTPDIITSGLNILFRGPHGRGKTHAACLLSREAIAHGFGAARVRWRVFCAQVRGTYNTGAETTENALVKSLCRVPWLFVDEVKEDLSEFEQRLISEVIEARYDAKLPTLLTCNLSSSELEDAIGIRAYDRFKARQLAVTFDGERFRDLEKTEVSDLIEEVSKAAASAVQTRQNRAVKH
jgi:DNA replication protein DnaC